MKNVVLDSYAANPGDLSWDFLSRFGEYEVYNSSKGDEIIKRAYGSDVIISNKIKMNGDMLKTLSEGGLKLISLLSTGYDAIDIEAAKECGVMVANVPSYSTYMVAQHTFALILELFDLTASHNAAVKAGKWAESSSFAFYTGTLHELFGKTLGIIGYGRIGKRVSAIAQSFGMNVLVFSRSKTEDKTVRQVELRELLESSDIVSLHCPLTDKTRGMIDKNALSLMKKTAYLINTSRGPVVDEDALFEALESGSIAGAGLDVLMTEPPAPDNRIVNARNCIVTPHIAWAGVETRRRLLSAVEENIAAYLAGKPQNIVNP